MASSVKAGEGRLHNVRLAGGGFDHAIPPPRGSPRFLSGPAFTDASAPGGRKTMATWLTVRGSRNFVRVRRCDAELGRSGPRPGLLRGAPRLHLPRVEPGEPAGPGQRRLLLRHDGRRRLI